VWRSNAPDGLWVGLFNLTETAATIAVTWSDLGVSGPLAVRDLWTGTEHGKHADGWSATVPPHGSVLVKLGM
jgi:hypothetical protein